MIPIVIWLFKINNSLVHFFRKKTIHFDFLLNVKEILKYWYWSSLWLLLQYFCFVFPDLDTHWNFAFWKPKSSGTLFQEKQFTLVFHWMLKRFLNIYTYQVLGCFNNIFVLFSLIMIPIGIWLSESQNPLVHFFRKNSSLWFFIECQRDSKIFVKYLHNLSLLFLLPIPTGIWLLAKNIWYTFSGRKNRTKV